MTLLNSAMAFICLPLSSAALADAQGQALQLNSAPSVTPDNGDGADNLLQFTSSGHVLGFGRQAVYLAGLDHVSRRW
jgi:hypothetical protein